MKLARSPQDEASVSNEAVHECDDAGGGRTSSSQQHSWWNSGEWQKVCVGGHVEHLYIPADCEVWCGYQEDEWCHRPNTPANSWIQMTFNKQRKPRKKRHKKPMKTQQAAEANEEGGAAETHEANEGAAMSKKAIKKKKRKKNKTEKKKPLKKARQSSERNVE